MLVKYSKKSSDIEQEDDVRLMEDLQKSKEPIGTIDVVEGRIRKNCVVCATHLKGDFLFHRKIKFMVCDTCGHIQTYKILSSKNSDTKFSEVYPKLSLAEYNDRKKRIYLPKLEWIINSLIELGYNKDQLQKMRWTEMGAGAGYFISSLLDSGFNNVVGFDADKELVEYANSLNRGDKIKHYDGDLSNSLEQFPADIHVAFFVLEHIDNTHTLISALKSSVRNKIFVFSVPVFGLTHLLENIFESNSPRCLDGIHHAQLYTDQSIKYSMHQAGFEIASQWIFGQDANDFTRYMICNLHDKFSKKMLDRIYQDLKRLENSFQNCLDRMRLSDQRHIIAVKR
jgi:2-polyprenyl-3-methyl-5-hydroxy-6-metoxy-1,4-benzoquinol methylase